MSSRSVAVVATSWEVVTARSTAFAGVVVDESKPLIRTLVSMTTRSRAIARQQIGESLPGQALRGSLRSDLIAEVEKRLNVSGAKPFVVRHRDHDGDVAVLPADDDWLPLCVIQDCT